MPAWIYSEDANQYFQLLSTNLKELAKLMQHSRQLTTIALPDGSTIQDKYRAITNFFGPDVFDLNLTDKNRADLFNRQKNDKNYQHNPFLTANTGFYKTLMDEMADLQDLYAGTAHHFIDDQFDELRDLIITLYALIKNKGLTEYSATIESLRNNITLLLDAHLLRSLDRTKKELKERAIHDKHTNIATDTPIIDTNTTFLTPIQPPKPLSAYLKATPETRKEIEAENAEIREKLDQKINEKSSTIIANASPILLSPLKSKVTSELLSQFHKKMNEMLHSNRHSEEPSAALIDFSDKKSLLPFPLEASILIAKVEKRIDELTDEIKQGRPRDRKEQKIEALTLLIDLVRKYPHQSFSIIEFVRETHPVIDKGGIFSKSITSQLLNELSIASIKFHTDRSLSPLARKTIEENNKQITRLTTERASVFSLHHATKQEKIKVLMHLNQKIVEIDKACTDQNRESNIQQLKLTIWQDSDLDKTFFASSYRVSTTTKTLFKNFRTLQLLEDKNRELGDEAADELSSTETTPNPSPYKALEIGGR